MRANLHERTPGGCPFARGGRVPSYRVPVAGAGLPRAAYEVEPGGCQERFAADLPLPRPGLRVTASRPPVRPGRGDPAMDPLTILSVAQTLRGVSSRRGGLGMLGVK